ncbi:MAG: hypothetical protein E7463_06750 [Ruminococcaceae bacterium]|nr:hypothetical protein [Oscillospiraceae bacterium]
MNIVFKLSPYNREALRAPLADALYRIAECMSRERNPGMWKFADRTNPAGRASAPSEKTLRRRYIRYRIYGVFFILLGIFCLIPGLVKPDELFPVLLAGIVGLVSGIFYLIRFSRKPPHEKLAENTELLLDQLESVYSAPADGAVQIRLTNRGLIFGEDEPIPYSRFAYAVENEQLIVILWGETVHYCVLPKADLAEGTLSALRDLLRRNVANPAMRLSLWQGED